jgi:hypothetical protein
MISKLSRSTLLTTALSFNTAAYEMKVEIEYITSAI